MKKYLYLLVAAFTLFASSTSFAQKEEDPVRTNMIVINPIKFILFWNLSYVHALNNNMAIGVGLQIPSLKGLSGFGGNAEVRFYPSHKALRGLYVAPNVSYNSLSAESGTTSDKVTASSISLGVLAGWQWFIGDDFAIGLGIGADYYILSGGDGNTTLASYKGVAPAFRFDIGYGW